MSFFKKLKSEFEDMFGDDDKKKDDKPSQPAQDAKPAENSEFCSYPITNLLIVDLIKSPSRHAISTSLSTLHPLLLTRMLSISSSPTLHNSSTLPSSSTHLSKISPMVSPVPPLTANLVLLHMDSTLHLLALLLPRLVVSYPLAGFSSSTNRVSASST